MRMNTMTKLVPFFLLGCLLFSACGEKPATPVPTADASEDTLIENLFDQANDPDAAAQAITTLKTRPIDSQKIILGRFIDSYLQRSGFGLGPERMELLKGLLALYYHSVNVVEIMEINRELNMEGKVEFAYLPERTIVVFANEITPMWEEMPPLEFADSLAQLFLNTGVDTNYLRAFVRSMEIRDYLSKLELSQAGANSDVADTWVMDEYDNNSTGLSISVPTDWVVEEIQEGVGLFSPTGLTAVTAIHLNQDSLPSELLSVFLQNARGGNLNLVTEDSLFSPLIIGVDDIASQRIINHYSYPSGVETDYFAEIVIIQKASENWLMLVTSNHTDQNMTELLNEMITSLQFK